MPEVPVDDAAARFASLLEQSLAQESFVRLALSKYRGPEADLIGVAVRRITLRDEPALSFVYRHKTRDITRNLALAQGLQALRDLRDWGHVHLLTQTHDVQLALGRKGKRLLRRGKADAGPAPSGQHDRAKHHFLDLDRPFLRELGVTDAKGQLVPAMSRKWKQINKFVEVFDHAFAASALKDTKQVRVLDFGSGKGYLTFAVHDHLKTARGAEPRITGVELREDMVRLCNGAAQRLGIEGLSFERGDVATRASEPVDVMIALHACDTATDHAIHMGIRSGAAIIMCSPCCHKQLRPQLLCPAPLGPMLSHGIHLGQEAEMVTDSLRALLLDANGYETQVFEFVSLEHTSKNKMILAVKRPGANQRRDEVLRQIADIKAFYSIREQCLETLLG